jgi:hypothetical protein
VETLVNTLRIVSDAGREDELGFFDHRDVFREVAVEQDQIGLFAFGDAADAVVGFKIYRTSGFFLPIIVYP